MRRHTLVLIWDPIRTKRSSQVIKAYISMLAEWCMEIKREQTNLKSRYEGEEDHGHSQHIKIYNLQ